MEAHWVGQSEFTGQLREAFEKIAGGVDSESVADPDEIPVDANGLPTWSPLTAPIVVNRQTMAEVDDMISFLNSRAKDREVTVDPILGEA